MINVQMLHNMKKIIHSTNETRYDIRNKDKSNGLKTYSREAEY
jgi:hypothetical protein